MHRIKFDLTSVVLIFDHSEAYNIDKKETNLEILSPSSWQLFKHGKPKSNFEVKFATKYFILSIMSP